MREYGDLLIDEIDYELSECIATFMFTLNFLRRGKSPISTALVQKKIIEYCHENGKEFNEGLINDVIYRLKELMKKNRRDSNQKLKEWID